MSSESFARRARIVEAGIARFYSEGFARWSKVDLETLWSPDWALESDEVQALLDRWERQGVIRRVGSDDCYIEVLPEFGSK